MASLSGAAPCAAAAPPAPPASRGRVPARRAAIIRSSYQTDRDAELGRNVPSAPPMRAPPPPPPPPPPPEPVIENELRMSRRGLFGILAGGSAAWWFAINSSSPIAAVDKERNVALLRTRGGATVAATQDAAGRVFMFDKAGNIYYDTEDPRLGLYIVDTQGNMYNEFVDEAGQVQRVPVGNIADLRTIEVEEVGGVPVRDLQRSIKDFRGGRITGFVQPADPSNLADLMPPTAPAGRSLDGRRIEPPPFLEDLEIELQPRGGGLFGGGGGGGAPADPAATLRSLQRGDK